MAHFFRFPLLLAAVLLLTGCTSNSLFNVTTPTNALRVGIIDSGPPLAYTKNNTLAGLEPLFAAGLANFTNRRLEMVNLPREKLFPALREKKIDIIMAGITVAEAQRHKLAATAPYLATGQTTLIRLGDYDQLGNGIRRLTEPSIRLGVVDGSTADTWLKGLRPKGTINRFDTAPEGVQALMRKNIDVFICNQTTNYYYASLYIDTGLTPGNILLTREALAWAVRPDDNNLHQAANVYLSTIRQNGELQKMLSQTIPFYRDTAYSPAAQ